MSPSTRAALGIASAFPAATTLVLPHVPDLVRPWGDGVVWAVLALLAAGLGATFAFVWIAAGARKPLGWRLSWVLGLTLFGVLSAPVFWWLYVRSPASRPAFS